MAKKRGHYVKYKNKTYKFNTFQKWSVERLEKYIKKEVRRANYDIKGLIKAGFDDASVAYRYLTKEGFKLKNQGFIKMNKQGDLTLSSRTKGLDKVELARRAYFIQTYNKTKSGSVKGVKQVYEKGYETFRSKMSDSSDFTLADYTRFWETEGLESFKKQYYSTFSRWLTAGRESGDMDKIEELITRYHMGEEVERLNQAFDEMYPDNAAWIPL